ncbi:MAG TPA: metallopeptidase family protein [Polyangiaceae bacterium]
MVPFSSFRRVDPQTFLSEVAALRSTDPAAALAKVELADSAIAEDPEIRLTRADLVWEVRGADAALPLLEELVTDVGDYADARHMLGCVYEEAGREADKVEQFSEVLRLDETTDPALDAEEYAELEDLIVSAAESGLDQLPLTFRTQLSEVPILVESRPSADLVRQGFDPRALGLFEGPTHLDHQNAEASEVPTRIVLYAANLLEQSVDEDQLRSEVETTVLHEVGHYFGLDENDLERMGLD